MKIWLPAIRANSGADVYTKRLAAALEAQGVEAEITWFPLLFEFVPEAFRLRKPPAGVDLIHANSSNAVAFTGMGIPLVVTVHHVVHDPDYAPYRSLPQALHHRLNLKWRESRAVLRADRVVAVSRHVAGTVASVFGRRDSVVIPNWVDCGKYLPKHSRRGSRFKLLVVGNNSKRKGVDLVKPLAARLGERFEVRITGGLRGGSNRRQSDGVVSLGTLTEGQLIAEYQACDAVVSLSRYEGFGYSALEGMACGKPAVAFAAGGLCDVIEDGECGFLAPIDDLGVMCNQIKMLADDDGLYQSMSAKARSRAITHSGYASRYAKIYNEVLSASRRY